MKTSKQILTEFMDGIIKGIQGEITKQGKYVTGETSNSLRQITTDSQSLLFGSRAVESLEYGRGPTKKGTGSGEPLINKVRRWVAARGISDPDKTQEQISWAITTKIHKEGTKQFRLPPSGILSNIINADALDRLTNLIRKNEVDKFREVIFDQQKNV